MGKTILCAIDISDPRARVVKFAIDYAKETGARIVALSVYPLPKGVAGFRDIPESVTKQVSKYVEDNFAGVDVSRAIVLGEPAETIVDYAKKNGCNMIVMGTHGRKGLGRVMFGSVASGVVNRAGAIPVVVIGTDD